MIPMFHSGCTPQRGIIWPGFTSAQSSTARHPLYLPICLHLARSTQPFKYRHFPVLPVHGHIVRSRGLRKLEEDGVALFSHTVAIFSFLTVPMGIALNTAPLCYIDNREFPGNDKCPPGPVRACFFKWQGSYFVVFCAYLANKHG